MEIQQHNALVDAMLYDDVMMSLSFAPLDGRGSFSFLSLIREIFAELSIPKWLLILIQTYCWYVDEVSSSRSCSLAYNTKAGAVAAFTVDLLVYPLDTLKTRLQSPDYKKRFTNGAANTLNKAAMFRGLYQGLGSVIIATLPSCIYPRFFERGLESD